MFVGVVRVRMTAMLVLTVNWGMFVALRLLMLLWVMMSLGRIRHCVMPVMFVLSVVPDTTAALL